MDSLNYQDKAKEVLNVKNYSNNNYDYFVNRLKDIIIENDNIEISRTDFSTKATGDEVFSINELLVERMNTSENLLTGKKPTILCNRFVEKVDKDTSEVIAYNTVTGENENIMVKISYYVVLQFNTVVT